MGILIVFHSIMYGIYGALIGIGVGGLFALVFNLILAKQDLHVVLREFCTGTFVVFGSIVGFLMGFYCGWTTADFAH